MVLFFDLVFPLLPGKFSADTLGSILEFQSDHAQRHKKGGKWSMYLGARLLEAHQQTLFRHLKTSFSAEI